MAIGAVLDKVLTFDLFRQTKTNGANGDADATGCFDRIIPPESQLSCRRWGVPKKAAKMITTVLNNTIYRIRTGHGISARTYQSNELRRILGVGQGSCAAPGIWMVVLYPILWSIANKFACFKMESPSGKSITRIGDAYVDDAVFQATLNKPTCSHQELIKSLPVLIEEILKDFERKLYVTGGELSLSKTFYYLSMDMG